MTPISNPAIASRIQTKLISIIRDLAAASGDVATTGVGFQPKALIAVATKDNSSPLELSGGFVDVNLDEGAGYLANTTSKEASLLAILADAVGGNYQAAIVKSFDADGFTLTWTKSGSPSGTGVIKVLCLR